MLRLCCWVIWVIHSPMSYRWLNVFLIWNCLSWMQMWSVFGILMSMIITVAVNGDCLICNKPNITLHSCIDECNTFHAVWSSSNWMLCYNCSHTNVKCYMPLTVRISPHCIVHMLNKSITKSTLHHMFVRVSVDISNVLNKTYKIWETCKRMVVACVLFGAVLWSSVSRWLTHADGGTAAAAPPPSGLATLPSVGAVP